MTEVRDPSGRFIGVTDLRFPPDRRDIILPVMRPFSPAWRTDPLEVMLAIGADVVRLERARWQDADGVRDILMLRDPTEMFARCRGVYVAGSTCETEYGRAVRFIETLARLYGLIRFHRLSPSCSVVH